MNEIVGNMWDYHDGVNYIVIPTNGSVKKDGTAVMGAGLARQAAERFPDLSRLLGKHIETKGTTVAYFDGLRIFCMPTKHHWKQRGDLGLVREGSKEIFRLVNPLANVYLPRVGCGHKGLKWVDVKTALLPEMESGLYTVIVTPEESEIEPING